MTKLRTDSVKEQEFLVLLKPLKSFLELCMKDATIFKCAEQGSLRILLGSWGGFHFLAELSLTVQGFKTILRLPFD